MIAEVKEAGYPDLICFIPLAHSDACLSQHERVYSDGCTFGQETQRDLFVQRTRKRDSKDQPVRVIGVGG